MIDTYTGIAPKGDLILLKRMGERLQGRTFLHVNSTKAGGGVAEILQRMVPMIQELGIQTRWEVIEGDAPFFETTKSFHNGLQGDPTVIAPEMWDHHYRINQANAERLDLDADMVLIHDPQPVPLIEFKKTGHWVWRCHIDLSRPYPEVWQPLRRYVQQYEGCHLFRGQIRPGFECGHLYYSSVHRSPQRKKPRPVGRGDRPGPGGVGPSAGSSPGAPGIPFRPIQRPAGGDPGLSPGQKI